MSCQTRINQNNIPKLWEWLQENESSLFEKYNTNPEETLMEIRRHIRRINHLLTCEIISDKEKHHLIISPNNVHELFDPVKDIVQQAPTLKYWKIIAFRPPQQLADIEEIKGQQFNIEDFKVAISQNSEGRFDLNIGVKNFEKSDYYKLLSAMFKILQKLLGEYYVEYSLGKVFLSELDENIHSIPLKDLLMIFENKN